MKQLLWLVIFTIYGPSAFGSFYYDYLRHAMMDCPGFRTNSSVQMKIDVPFSSYGQARHRYDSTCYSLLQGKEAPISVSSSAKTHSKEDNPSGPEDEDENEEKCEGSIIFPTSGTVGEKVKIIGTSFDLTYFTNRVLGKTGKYKVDIPINDPYYDPVAPIQGYRIQANYAGGRVIDQTFNNLADQVFNFEWDGKDINGNLMVGSIPFDFIVSIRIFHGPTHMDFKWIPISYKNFVGGLKAEFFGMGAWTPSVYHFYDVPRGRLMLGAGQQRMAEARELAGGNLMVASDDASEVYIFNSEGFHLYTKYGLTGENKFVFNHDSNNLITSIEEPYGQVTTFTRVDGKVTEIISPKNLVTSLSYDSEGYLNRIVNPDGHAHEMEYYPKGLIKRFTKPEGQSSTFYYDSKGNLTKDFHSSGFYQNYSMTYENGWPVARLSTPSGVTNKYTVENAFQMHELMQMYTHRPSGLTYYTVSRENSKEVTYPTYRTSESYSSDPRFPESAQYTNLSQLSISDKGALESSTKRVQLSNPADPFSIESIEEVRKVRGKTAQAIYDGDEREWTTVSAENRIEKLKINEYEKPIRIQIGNYLPTNISYDSSGRISKTSQGKKSSQFEYDSNGFLSANINSLGQKTVYKRDDNGRISEQILPDKRVVSYEYDGNGNLVSLTPPSRPKHSFFLNAFEQIKTYLPPLLGGQSVATQYFYDIDRRLSKIVFPDGREIKHFYNSASGLLEQTQAPNGFYYYTYSPATEKISTAYTPEGWASAINYYGPFKSEETQSFGLSNEAKIKWLYDDEHRVTHLNVLASGQASNMSRAYDKDDLVIRNGAIRFQRNNSAGSITQAKIDNTRIDYTYDSNYGELNKIEYFFKSKSQLRIEYQRDKMGRISFEQSEAPGHYYFYDTAGRFIGRQPFGSAGPSHQYSYDPNGNRIWSKTPDGIIEATYDNHDRLLTWGELTFQYGENGDLQTRTNSSSSEVTEYDYDVFGNLRSVTLPDSSVITYDIDAFNRRVGKKISGTRVARYIYEDQLRIAAEIDENNNITKRFVYGDGSNVPDYMEYDGEKYIFVKDIRGSVLKVVNSRSGEVSQELEYDDWGKVVKDTAPGFQPFGFAGGLYDHHTKLVRFGARDYDAETGRWTTKDPIRFDGGDVNLYGYVMRDPINEIDPAGKKGVGVGTATRRGAVSGIGVGVAVGVITRNPIAGAMCGLVAGAAVTAVNLIEDFDPIEEGKEMISRDSKK